MRLQITKTIFLTIAVMLFSCVDNSLNEDIESDNKRDNNSNLSNNLNSKFYISYLSLDRASESGSFKLPISLFKIILSRLCTALLK